MVKRSHAFVIGAFLLAVVPLSAQSRTARRSAPRREPPAATAPSESPNNPPTPPSPPPQRGPGVVIPPNQGYVAAPDRAPAGTVGTLGIPSDPLDRAYWELYDRDRSVTLTGKVTRVDWSNPNSYIYMAADGGLWAVESGFIQFRQSSVTPAIRVDEIITVKGYLPKDQPLGELPAKRSTATSSYLKTNHLIRAGEITTVFGQKLVMGIPPTEEEMNERLKCSALGC